MAIFCFFLLVFLPALCLSDTSSPYSLLWPLPREVNCSESKSVTVDSKNFNFIGIGEGGGSELLKDAFSRYQKYTFPQEVKNSAGVINSAVVNVSSSSEDIGLNTNETYNMTISQEGVYINATTVYGAMRGLETLSQLVYMEDDQYYVYLCSVGDTPRFQHRGFMIDTSRHFVSVAAILKFLDAMSFNKFNVFHWHIVDDESFPYESLSYPSLSEKGAYDQHHVYSQADVKTVIQYAKERGIRVIPEFDTPGHSLSWGLGIPGLTTACYDNSTHKPTGSYGPIDPTNETNWSFLTGFFKELAEVFMDDYIHLGGDEVSYTCWSTNPAIWKWMEEHNITGQYDQLEQYYETRLLDIVKNLNKEYVVWQEIFDNGLKVQPDTVIDVWKSNKDSRAAITKAGLRAIYSACWYLNRISYGADWHNAYLCDPRMFEGSDEQKKLVVGGEACIWGEFVDSTNIISRSWPRGSAVGERLWSDENLRNITDATIRLHSQRCRMISRGIQAEPVSGPSFCPIEWTGGKSRYRNSF